MSAAPTDDNKHAREGPGFYGKLPSHGDFISRRLPPNLLAAWGAWLDAGIEHSREMLGEAWLKTYLSSPIWCFSASTGCCGDRSFAGVLMPSLDRIGRYYPLSILALVDAGRPAAEIAAEAAEWFQRMEEVALTCLADEFDFAAFDAALAIEPLPPARESSEALLQVPPPAAGPAAAIPRLLGQLLEQSGVPYSLWWTTGSQTVAAGCRVFSGLPPQHEFRNLLG